MIFKGRRLPLYLGIFIVVVDFISKGLVTAFIPLMTNQFPYGGIALFQDFLGVDFSIVHAVNFGAAWSLFSGYTNALLFIRMAFIIPLLFWTLFINQDKSRSFPLSFILAGAIGNIIDTLYNGFVVDMFYFVFWGYSYPVFNVADISICLGVAILFLQSLVKEKAIPHAR